MDLNYKIISFWKVYKIFNITICSISTKKLLNCWKVMQITFLILPKCAKSYFRIAPTLAPIEKIFSKISLIINKNWG